MRHSLVQQTVTLPACLRNDNMGGRWQMHGCHTVAFQLNIAWCYFFFFFLVNLPNKIACLPELEVLACLFFKYLCTAVFFPANLSPSVTLPL